MHNKNLKQIINDMNDARVCERLVFSRLDTDSYAF